MTANQMFCTVSQIRFCAGPNDQRSIFGDQFLVTPWW